MTTKISEFPPHDVFRWKCAAIVEGLMEGATRGLARAAELEYRRLKAEGK